jgi:uncharacterized protein (TIGR02246 family)
MRRLLCALTFTVSQVLMADVGDGVTDLTAFAEAYTAAWNSQQPSRVADFYAADGVLIINGGEPSRGREGVTEAARAFMEAFPDLEIILDRLSRDGERVNYHWTLIGTHSGPGGTGRRVRISGFESWIFDEAGLVLESLGTFDADDYERQLNEGPVVAPQ